MPRGIVDIRPLTGGASSLTYTGTLRARRVVVKVAPPGVEPTRHRDVLRQSRAIRAFVPTEVPVPEVLWEDEGDPPDEPPLFVMSFLEGTSFEPLFDLGGPEEPEHIVAARYRDAAATMGRLHRIRPDSLPLGSEPVVGLDAEIERWCRALGTVEASLVPNWPDVADALRSYAPAALPAAVVHGDFRLGNLLAVADHITAVIDWEIWTLGDPRVDAGWFLINCDPHTYRRATRYSGLTPPPMELASIYRTEMGHQVPDLDWFQALACFKSAATWSLIVKHNRRRSTPRADLEAMVPVLPELLLRARDLLG